MGNFIKDYNTFVNESHRYEYDGKFFDTKQQKAAYVKNKKSHEDALLRREEDKKTLKSREFICKSCGIVFTKDMTDKEFSNQKNHPNFCSRSCANKRIHSDETKMKISNSLSKYSSGTSSGTPHYQLRKRECIVCGNEFYTQSGGRKTCSNDCMNYYKTHRNDFLSNDSKLKIRNGGLKSVLSQSEKRRSKNEIYFCELCESQFENVTHNEQIFNGWDADVLIYDFKIAVLWNGNWHYKEIKKGNSLKQIQNRDAKKYKEIEDAGWTPYIIEDRGKYNKTFVEYEFKKIIEFIQKMK